jgi:O-methyltransferase
MNALDRLAARMPWSRIAGELQRERKALKGVSRRLDAAEQAQLDGADRLMRTLTERLDAADRAHLEAASATAQALAALGEGLRTGQTQLQGDIKKRFARIERAQQNTTTRLDELSERFDRRDAALLGLTRRQMVQLAPPEFHALVREVREDERTLLGADRLYVLWQAALNTVALGLPSLEIGTFRGGSARFLAGALRSHAGEERELHVVDTFEGHAAADTSDFERAHEPGRFADTSLEDVREYLSGFARLRVHRARFPEGAGDYVPAQVGLVHLDVDLYTPTAAALALLADRAVPGTVIVVDDYGAVKTPGIVKAVEEFLAAGHPFQIWDVDSEQAVLVRR